MSWGKVDDKLINHPKIKAAAKDLKISRAFMVGYMVVFWAGVRDHHFDGDLSGIPDDEIAFLAEYEGDAERFVATLQKRRLLDGKLVHDWLDYNGEWLRTRFKTRDRHLLVVIWAKHGRVYGQERGTKNSSVESVDDDGNNPGTEREQSGNPPGTDESVQDIDKDIDQDKALDQGEEALNPPAQGEKETKSPNGGSGGETGVHILPPEQESFSIFSAPGLRAQGLSPPTQEFPCGGFTAQDVFASGFGITLRFFGINCPQELQRRADHCKSSPAHFTMVLLDKVDAVFRTDNGPALIDSDDADPVAMTVSGLRPRPGRPAHTPTDSARGFFVDVMQDSALALAGQHSRFKNQVSPLTVSTELRRRKGKGRNHDAISTSRA